MHFDGDKLRGSLEARSSGGLERIVQDTEGFTEEARGIAREILLARLRAASTPSASVGQEDEPERWRSPATAPWMGRIDEALRVGLGALILMVIPTALLFGLLILVNQQLSPTGWYLRPIGAGWGIGFILAIRHVRESYSSESKELRALRRRSLLDGYEWDL